MATIVTRAGKGSALTWTEGDANFDNLNNDKIEAVLDDTSPQLGGDLDIKDKKITTTTVDGDILLEANGTGIVQLKNDVVIGTGTAAAYVTSLGAYDLNLVTNSNTNSGIITIIDGANGNITITPNGTGNLVLDGLNWPQVDGTANYVLKTNGAGQLSWTAQTVDTNTTYSISAETATGGVNLRLSGSDTTTDDVKLAAGANITLTRTDASTITIAATDTGIASVSADTNPSLGGNLSVSSYKIVSASNGNIELEPNGTGDVYLTADTVRVGDSNAAATLTTNGTGNLVINTNSGTNSGSITINQGSNADITIDVNGTGTINFSDDIVRQAVLKDYAETIYDLGTTSGTITPDVANGNIQKITLNGNLTFSAFSNPATGQSMTLIINTNGTNRTLTSTMKFAGGSKTISTTSTIDIISVFYDGTNYYASLAKGFA